MNVGAEFREIETIEFDWEIGTFVTFERFTLWLTPHFHQRFRERVVSVDRPKCTTDERLKAKLDAAKLDCRAPEWISNRESDCWLHLGSRAAAPCVQNRARGLFVVKTCLVAPSLGDYPVGLPEIPAFKRGRRLRADRGRRLPIDR